MLQRNGFSFFSGSLDNSMIVHFMIAMIRSIIRLVICSFIHSFVHSFNRSFIHSFIHPYVHSFIHSFIRSFYRSFNRSIIHSLIRHFIHSFIHSLIKYFLHFRSRWDRVRVQVRALSFSGVFYGFLLSGLSLGQSPSFWPGSTYSCCHSVHVLTL